MSKNGIVRRIDELGRLVIPKELRKSLRIKEGDSVEIFAENDKIIVKRFSSVEKLKDFADLLVSSINKDIRKNLFITDTSKVISASGKCRKNFINNEISDYLIECIMRRESILEKYKKEIIFINDKINCSYIIDTIISNGDVVGCIVMFDEDESINEFDYKIIRIMTSYLSKAIEN